MIILIILIIFSLIGIILFKILEDKASYGGVAKFFAYLGILSPILSSIFLLLWINMELSAFRYIKENKVNLYQDIIIMQQNNTINDEIIERAEKHNKNCEAHYEEFQKTIAWSLLGKFRESALNYKVEVPKMTENGDTSEITTTQSATE